VSGRDAPSSRPRSSLLPRLLLGLAAVLLFAAFAFVISGAGFTRDDAGAPRLFGLLAILVFVAAGLLGRQMKTWHILRAMFAWAAIILVVAGVYASREEIAGFAGRLVGALVPGVPVSGRLAGEANPDSVVVTRAGDGHFAVRASVDDVPLTMLIDTGASLVTLSQRDAERVGVDPASLAYVVPIRTANGTMRAASVTLDSLAIGTITQRNVPALVAPPGALGQSLLGMSFLDGLHGYAISGDRLVLTP